MTLKPLEITGEPPPGEPGFLCATVLPDRGMMLLQARLRLPSGEVVDALYAPELTGFGGPEDVAGNRSFAFGGAILAPYANRIRGRLAPGGRQIDADLDDRAVRLPANWRGKAKGAEPYAMHGLILAAAAEGVDVTAHRVTGRVASRDFAGEWPGDLTLEIGWSLEGGALRLEVTARNDGERAAPVGLGWHPWFVLPSGRRDQARLRLPARMRCEVGDYDAVLPTGRLLPVAGTAHDFNGPDGAALDGHLDDAFTGLVRENGAVVVEIIDPAADLRLTITSPSQAVTAVQIYAPTDQAVVVVEPQFNLADPFSPVWPPAVETGMVWLGPGDSAAYVVEVRAEALGNRPGR